MLGEKTKQSAPAEGEIDHAVNHIQQLQRAGEAAELDLAGTLWLLHRRSIASFTRLT